MSDDCTCETCKGACQHKPGWFMPGEAERAADHLGIALEDFFATKLGVDWWEDTGDDERITETVFVLAPATTTMSPGEEYPGEPKGQCVFYVDGLCSIHEVKPFECREFIHGEPHHMAGVRHSDVAVAWIGHQDEVEKLLGHEPIAEEYGGGLFGGLLSGGLFGGEW